MSGSIISLIALSIMLLLLLALLFFLVLGLLIMRRETEITFLTIIKYILNLGSLLAILVILFIPDANNLMWDISLYSVFVLMCIRPLQNLFPKLGFIRLMPLRKNLGILSATIVMAFAAIHYMGLGWGFFALFFSRAHWKKNVFWGHLGEVTGFILLITSNKLSIRILKRNWKRIQRLSYVYFFSGSWYVFKSFNKTFGLIAIIIVFELTILASIKNRMVRRNISIIEDKGEQYLAALFIILLIILSNAFSLTIVNKNNHIVDLGSELKQSRAILSSYEKDNIAIQSENEKIQAEIDSIHQKFLDKQAKGANHG